MADKQGKIIKGIGGFYYVYVTGEGVYECKAKGAFRKSNEKPLVGDECVLVPGADSTPEKLIGNIEQIKARKNTLIRPEVANVDQALIIFALT
ncbi:MAG: ribosome small subunit-dependent GTPase A, partial [Lachnospiraceae bacterium]|nr:ribosome small subunit-dependent GTPase A [Lachnospiraceae bacterium]